MQGTLIFKGNGSPPNLVNKRPKSADNSRSHKECRRKSESLEKYHGTQDKKDKDNDKYIERDKDKDRQRQKCRRIRNNC